MCDRLLIAPGGGAVGAVGVGRRRGKSGRGLPHSKTWRNMDLLRASRSVLECGSPVSLFHEPDGLTDGSNRTRRAVSAARPSDKLRPPYPGRLRSVLDGSPGARSKYRLARPAPMRARARTCGGL